MHKKLVLYIRNRDYTYKYTNVQYMNALFSNSTNKQTKHSNIQCTKS